MAETYPNDQVGMSDEETIIMKPFHYQIEDDFKKRGWNSILIWAKNVNSVTHLLRINQFPSYLCLELPKYVYETDEVIPWSPDLFSKIFEYFKWCMAKKGFDQPYDYVYQKKSDIYYFSHTKKSYIYLLFPNNKSRYEASKMCNKERKIMGVGIIKIIPIENGINCLRRLMSIRNCTYNQFFSVKGRHVSLNYSDRISRSSIKEYFINWKTMNAISETESASWLINPTIVAWDIETYSDNHRSMPSSYNLKHCIWLISVVSQVLNRPETKKRVCIIFGDSNDVEATTIYRTSTEIDLLNKFAEVILELDPDIISDYNGFNYDYNYVIDRYNINNVTIPNMGRLINRETKIYDKNWASSGYGKNSITFIEMDGRIPIDLLPNVKRLFKLRKYSLDFVSNFFLGRGKHDMTAKKMFEIYEQSLTKDPDAIIEMTKVLEYCVQDSNLVIDLFDKINLWYYLCESSNVSGVPILDLFISGEQIRCYSQVYHQCYLRGFALSNPKHFDYYYPGGFVGDPIRGLHEYVFTLDFASLYPSIIRAYNLCYTTFVPRELWGTIRNEDCYILKFSQEEPRNYVSTTRLNDEGNDEIVRDEDVIEGDKIVRHYEFHFVKPHVRVGILPDICKTLTDERNKVKKEIKRITKLNDVNPSKEYEVQLLTLDSKQKAIKVSTNSVYGFTGVENGKLPGKFIAMTITSLGRSLIGQANVHLEEKFKHLGAKIVYNDTDSSMVGLDLKGDEDFNAIGEAMADSINGVPEKKLEDGTIIPAIPGIFLDPLKMEFEDCCRMLPLKKKMYLKAKRDMKTRDFYRDANGEIEVSSKGVLTARRGNSKFSMTVYSDCYKRLISRDNIVNVMHSLKKFMVSLMRGEMKPREYLTKVNELGANYKSENFFMNVFAGNLAREGNPVKASDRIEYIIVSIPEEKENIGKKIKDQAKILLGNKCREITMWEQNPNREEIDYLYYMEKGIQDPYDFLFQTGFIDIVGYSQFEQLGYKPVFSRAHFKHFSTPVKMIVCFVEDYMKATDTQIMNILGEKYNPSSSKIVNISYILEHFINNICNCIGSYVNLDKDLPEC